MGPEHDDFWVFGYGSLMWRPDFDFIESRRGVVLGYHRSLCIYSHIYRGTPDRPGLVFGLDRGGSCPGLLFRVAGKNRRRVMEILHEREMNNGVYVPRWLRARLDGGLVDAFGFVARHESAQYAGRLPLPTIVTLIRQGHGSGGSCRDYVANTADHLESLGVTDRPLRAIMRALQNPPGRP